MSRRPSPPAPIVLQPAPALYIEPQHKLGLDIEESAAMLSLGEQGYMEIAERIFETSYPCAVGDIIAIPPSVLTPHAGFGAWKIVAREAAAAPYAARLIVTPASR